MRPSPWALEHIVWDWNGTLLDDSWLCLEILNELLTTQGLPTVTPEHYREIFDFPVRDYYERAGFDLAATPFEELAAYFVTEYERRRFECSLRSGAPEVLGELQAAGLGQSLLSAYRHDYLVSAVASWGIGEHFLRLAGQGDAWADGKEGLGRRHVATLGLTPERVAFVGDTTHDAQVAAAVGARCILVDGGTQARHRLQATAAVREKTSGKMALMPHSARRSTSRAQSAREVGRVLRSIHTPRRPGL